MSIIPLICKNCPIFLVPLLLLLLLPAAAEAKEDFRIGPNPDSSNGTLCLQWQGKEGVYYFIETTLDLTAGWSDSWFRAAKGAGAELSFRFLPTTRMAFYRLHPVSDPLSSLALADPDNDGIGSALELDKGMNALSAETIEDTENSGTGDGLPDYWERFYFGDLSRDGSQDFDNDGIIDRIEWQMKTDPTVDQASAHPLATTDLRQYRYNTLGQLVSASGPVDLAYAYDDAGNLQSAQ